MIINTGQTLPVVLDALSGLKQENNPHYMLGLLELIDCLNANPSKLFILEEYIKIHNIELLDDFQKLLVFK